jgi:hypothetical protein
VIQFGHLGKVNKLEISDSAECLLCIFEIFLLKCFRTKGSPVLLSDTQARKAIGSCEVFHLEVPKERRRLWHINGVHVAIVQTEDL